MKFIPLAPFNWCPVSCSRKREILVEIGMFSFLSVRKRDIAVLALRQSLRDLLDVAHDDNVNASTKERLLEIWALELYPCLDIWWHPQQYRVRDIWTRIERIMLRKYEALKNSQATPIERRRNSTNPSQTGWDVVSLFSTKPIIE